MRRSGAPLARDFMTRIATWNLASGERRGTTERQSRF